MTKLPSIQQQDLDISLLWEVLWLLGGGTLVVKGLGIYGASKHKTWPLTAVRTHLFILMNFSVQSKTVQRSSNFSLLDRYLELSGFQCLSRPDKKESCWVLQQSNTRCSGYASVLTLCIIKINFILLESKGTTLCCFKMQAYGNMVVTVCRYYKNNQIMLNRLMLEFNC